jgi:RNA polymerase sigma-70 factor, ECF subfamily
MQTGYALRGEATARSKDVAVKVPDEALIASIAHGDKRAMQVLYARHSVRVFRFIVRLTGNASLAEDMLSEVFLYVWRRAEAFEAKSKVSTWLLAIARYKAISAMRRDRDEPLDDARAAAVEDPADNAETVVHAQQRSALIRRCLTQLSPAHRQVIDLVYYHEKSVEEVAQVVGIPVSTVKTRMFYARARMAELLAEAGADRAWL